MSLWDKITGKKTLLSESELLAKAEAFVQELERVANTDPKAAITLLHKRPPEIESLIDLSGKFNERFATTVLALKYRQDLQAAQRSIGLNYRDLPAYKIITDKEVQTFGELLDAAQNTTQPLIYLLYPDFYRKLIYAILNLEVLCEFATETNTLLVFLDEVNLFILQPFLLSATAYINRNTKIGKVPEELSRFAEKQPAVEFDDYRVTTFGYRITKFYQRV